MIKKIIIVMKNHCVLWKTTIVIPLWSDYDGYEKYVKYKAYL